MKIYRKDIEDICLGIAFISFLFAIAYLAEGGSNILIQLYTVTYGVISIGGILQGISESLEDYYYKKRCERLRRQEILKK